MTGLLPQKEEMLKRGPQKVRIIRLTECEQIVWDEVGLCSVNEMITEEPFPIVHNC